MCGINRLLVSEGIGTEALHREFEPLFGDREHDVEEQEHVGVVIAHPVHVVVVCEGPLVYTSGSKDIFMAIKKADKTMTQTHGKQTLNCFWDFFYLRKIKEHNCSIFFSNPPSLKYNTNG